MSTFKPAWNRLEQNPYAHKQSANPRSDTARAMEYRVEWRHARTMERSRRQMKWTLSMWEFYVKMVLYILIELSAWGFVHMTRNLVQMNQTIYLFWAVMLFYNFFVSCSHPSIIRDVNLDNFEMLCLNTFPVKTTRRGGEYLLSVLTLIPL